MSVYQYLGFVSGARLHCTNLKAIAGAGDTLSRTLLYLRCALGASSGTICKAGLQVPICQVMNGGVMQCFLTQLFG
jgi:hypothetical protein